MLGSLAAMSCPLVVVSDLHLSHTDGRDAARDLAQLLDAGPGAELLLAGDTFDLSLDPPSRDPGESAAAVIGKRAELAAALRARLVSGTPVTLLGGNHDAAVTQPAVRDALLAKLDLTPGAPLTTASWFVRRGETHIEHGHLYDPDNAPAHPLAPWSYQNEPLGVALTRRFLAPAGALQFSHAHATTPAAGLARTFENFGWRAPLIVARYFATATQLCLETRLEERRAAERQLGQSALPGFAHDAGIDAARLDALMRVRPKPTHHDFFDTFMRLYFDRVIATVVGASSAAAAVVTASAPALGLAALSAGYLAYSVVTGGSRYGDGPGPKLRDAARDIARLTGARNVVLGHTHCEDDAPGYLNTGSFAFSSGRPYAYADEHGRVERRRFSVA